ncbi:hypothetical protein [Streptomyces olivaceiscleroticus]|uniref:Uncharacterized protein n=1 Tax=Streptomyces olivaceiscleroticus TaxID=68245 RepID=A0ABN0ZL59_9ACTN
MTTAARYEIETSEGDDATTHPVEYLSYLSAPGEDAAVYGFVAYHGLYVAGRPRRGDG